ncbi:uncharacterized protein TRIADDRAFT_51924 [Trichoplax adhaerens]|uniref:AAA+ ATPase domain-containing protein n=1 Tax=Trichoplax adhaerens TaxID=10228 RepID=B3RL91_TRIAD|nr:hypothetical protein TRIADDRAFT_51924 [Trichoplax adhaerens]EDV29505.1 hypothetical protein TRIADDRAFT_51924 [Trichoplax adhaerens]|eukprot:XP_002108707.1 hypothetical protein TRIADDRAFT_51924 [Trichoplax adhaerens]
MDGKRILPALVDRNKSSSPLEKNLATLPKQQLEVQGITRQVLPDVIKKAENNSSVYRTTLLKKDKERIRNLRNRNDDESKIKQNATKTQQEEILSSKESEVGIDGKSQDCEPIKPIKKNDQRRIKSFQQENQEDNLLKRPKTDDVYEYLVWERNQIGLSSDIQQFRRQLQLSKSKHTVLEMDNKKNEDLKFLFRRKDGGQFVYALPRSGEACNPYDLKIVNASSVLKCASYYTASASNITLIKSGEEVECLPTLLWMHERDLFHQICRIPFFTKFRLFKYVYQWKRVIRYEKCQRIRSYIKQDLFLTQYTLQRAALTIRSWCEAASSSLDGRSSDDSGIVLVVVTTDRTLSLNEFIRIQTQQRHLAEEKLKLLYENVVQIVSSVCQEICEHEGINLNFKFDAEIRSGSSQQKKKSLDHAAIVRWRAVLDRLRSFLKYIDYLILELSRRIVIVAMRLLLAEFVACANVDSDQKEWAVKYLSDMRKKTKWRSRLIKNENDLLLGTEKHNVINDGAKALLKLDLVIILPEKDGNNGSSTKGTSSLARSKGKSIEMSYGKRKSLETSLYKRSSVDYSQYRKIHSNELASPRRQRTSIQLSPNKRSSGEIASHSKRSSIELNQYPRTNVELLQQKRTSVESLQGTRTNRLNAPRKSIIVGMNDQPSNHKGRKKSVAFTAAPVTYQYPNQIIMEPLAFDHLTEDEEDVTDGSIIAFQPDRQDFRQKMQDIIGNIEKCVLHLPSLLKQACLHKYWSTEKYYIKLSIDKNEGQSDTEKRYPWPDIHFIFGDDNIYNASLRKIFVLLKEAIEDVAMYCKEYDHFCEMVDSCGQIDVNNSMAQHEWSTDEFQEILQQHTEQPVFVAPWQDIYCNHATAFIVSDYTELVITLPSEVDTTLFRNTILPFPEKILKDIYQHLPTIASKKNTELITTIKTASKKLDKYPESVEEFVEHLSFLALMLRQLPSLEKEFTVVTKLFTLIRDFDIVMEGEELALYQTLMPTFTHLKSVIIQCEAKRDENIQKFTNDLEYLVDDLKQQLYVLKQDIRVSLLLDADTISIVALGKIHELTDRVDALVEKAHDYSSYQDQFGAALSAATKRRALLEQGIIDGSTTVNSALSLQSEIGEVQRDLSLRRMLWESMDEWDKLYVQLIKSELESLDVEGLQKTVNRFAQTVFLLDKGLPVNNILPTLKEKVLRFREVMPIISSLKNESLKQRHWTTIQRILGPQIRTKGFTLGELLTLQIMDHRDEIIDVSTQAVNESILESMLHKMIDSWLSTDFTLVPHTNGTFIIGAADDIFTLLDESQVTLATIKGSRYVEPIKNTMEEWDKKLDIFTETFEEWLICQRKWLYLENIFATADIQRQLPVENKLFSQVDKSWRDIMRHTHERPNAMRSATAAGVLEILQAGHSHLDKIFKCLEDYLETKRLVCPRFYFLSNEELLDVISNSKNPKAIQPHLSKCFSNVKQLMLDKEADIGSVSIIAMISSEYETVKLIKELNDGIRTWNNLEKTAWFEKNFGQIILTTTQIMFCKHVTSSLLEKNHGNSLKKIREDLISDLNRQADLAHRPLPLHKYESLVALMTISVHNRDIVAKLIDSEVSNPDDFEWDRQLRYEWDDLNKSCDVNQSGSHFEYGYEYLGCSSRLVITPLTDRCYLTLTGALKLNLGGSPAGPAGTGKTETIKDLAKAMGKYCVAFNCSEGVDFKVIGKFLSGLAQSGSWCCFDEFNRIDVEVLSVVAQQMHTIKSAKDRMATRFVFEGYDIKLIKSCGVFITMNPGYAGRVELPDNVKSLFRPVAMMIPDYAMIAEIILFAGGFTEAAALSYKIVNLYQLASKQLSQQDHYDFGLRAIKSVLVTAAQLKRSCKHEENISRKQHELEILAQAIQNANLPKFIVDDIVIFERIMDDVFPNIRSITLTDRALQYGICVAMREDFLVQDIGQIRKISQLYETLLVRHGVMIIGPTGGGKSVAYTILAKALFYLPIIRRYLEENGKIDDEEVAAEIEGGTFGRRPNVQITRLNPKCVSLGELYGAIDDNTMEWTDGILAHITRRYAKEAAPADPVIYGISPGVITRMNSPHDEPDTTAEDDVENQTNSSQEEEEETENDEQPIIEENEQVEVEANVEPIEFKMWRWIVLDGPVDPLWIENLNTVLDDTKMLCLANGERIGLSDGMRLLFEASDLKQASPATVSRCGMVYMDPKELGWRPYVRHWIGTVPKALPDMASDLILQLFDASVDRGFAFLDIYSKYQYLKVPLLSVISTLCSIIQIFLVYLDTHGGFGHRSSSAEDEATAIGSVSSLDTINNYSSYSRLSTARPGSITQLRAKTLLSKIQHQSFLQRQPGMLLPLMGKIYVFAFTWAFGGSLEGECDYDDDPDAESYDIDRTVNARVAFNAFVHELFNLEPPLAVQLPNSKHSIFSYYIDMQTGNFTSFDTLISPTKEIVNRYDETNHSDRLKHILDNVSSNISKYTQILPALNNRKLIPTIDTVRYSFLMALLLCQGRHVLVTGESGIGKSALVKDTLKCLEKQHGTGFGKDTILGKIFNKARATGDNPWGGKSKGVQSEEKDLYSTEMASAAIQFAANTTASKARQQLQSVLVKRGKNILGAPGNKKMTIFVDDINLPQRDQFHSQPALEVLRQNIDSGGFYDVKSYSWKTIYDVAFVAACAPPEGSRSQLNERILRHFCVLCISKPSDKSLRHIFQSQLGQFLTKNEFTAEVRDCMAPLVSSAIAIYRKIDKVMLPTPSKPHYTFNVRNLAQVIQGLTQADPLSIVTKQNYIDLLIHEVSRVFYDRLVDQDDRKQFYKIVSNSLHDYFKASVEGNQLQRNTLVFCDFSDEKSHSLDRVYKPVSDFRSLTDILVDFNNRYKNSTGKENQIIFFNECIQHIVRAARVFRQPGGNMLLVGIGGTGKQVVAELAAYIAQCQIHYLNVIRGYGMTEFHEDLRSLFLRAGVDGVKCVFILKDEHIVKRVQENLHIAFCTSPTGKQFRKRCRTYSALVNCCTIDWYDEWPANALHSVATKYLYNLDIPLPKSKDNAKSKSNKLTNLQNYCISLADACVAFFMSSKEMATKMADEIKRHYYLTPTNYLDSMHLFAKMLSDQQQKIARNKERLKSGLSKLQQAETFVISIKDELVKLGPLIELKAQENEKLMTELKNEETEVEKMKTLIETEEALTAQEAREVEQITKDAELDLNKALPALDAANSALNALDKSDIAEIRVYTNPPDLVMTVMAAVCTLLQEKADWVTAKQLLTDTTFLVKLITFDKSSLSDRNLARLHKYTSQADFTPEKVGQVSVACKSMCQWVLAVQHYAEVYKIVKPKMNRYETLKNELELARDNLDRKQQKLREIEKHLKDLQKRYKKSVADHEYLWQHKELSTLRQYRATLLTKSLSGEKDRWSDAIDELDIHLETIVGDSLLSAAYSTYAGAFTVDYRKQLISDWVGKCSQEEIPIAKNYSFISHLSSNLDMQGWHALGLPKNDHSRQNAVIVMNCYKWPLMIDPQGQARLWIRRMEGERLKLVKSTDVNYMRTLENAIRVGEPVLLEGIDDTLDPSLRPILLKHLENRGGQAVIQIGDTELAYNSNFRLYLTTQLANPIYLPETCAKVTVVNFSTTFDGLRDQLLSIVVQKEKPQLEIQRQNLLESIASDKVKLRDIEDKVLTSLQDSEGNILDDENLVTSLEESKKTSAVIKERVSQSESTQRKIDVNRNKFFPIATRGAIIYFALQDLAFINHMYQFSLAWFTNLFSDCISNIKNKRPASSPASTQRRASSRRILNIQAEIHSSTPTNDGYNVVKEEEKPEEKFETYIRNSMYKITMAVYRLVSQGLFSRHQLTFSFILTTRILASNHGGDQLQDKSELITEMEWNTFLHGAHYATKDTHLFEEKKRNPLSHSDSKQLSFHTGHFSPSPVRWITDSAWHECRELAKRMIEFHGLTDHILNNKGFWEAFSKSEIPYFKLKGNVTEMSNEQSETNDTSSTVSEDSSDISKEENPFQVSNLSCFHRLILIKVLRPDVLSLSIWYYIEESMGNSLISAGGFDIKEIYKQSNCKTPLIFLLSPGSDPISILERFARDKFGSITNIDIVSLGRGQGPRAVELINKACSQQNGRWVLLQNCHLAESFMPELRRIVDEIVSGSDTIDPYFRLWLSSKPDPFFPVDILQAGLKISVEPPQGLKANLLQSFNSGLIYEESFEDHHTGPAWKKVLFGLCFFNAVVLERKKYGPLGWNIPYEFSTSDLEVSIQLLRMLLSEEDTPWDKIHYLIGELAYGGRVTDEWDRRCLRGILTKFCGRDCVTDHYSYTSNQVYRPIRTDASFTECIEYIESLPPTDSSEVFGMHQTAEKTFLLTQGKLIVEVLQAIDSHGQKIAGYDQGSDGIVLQILEEMQSTIPLEINLVITQNQTKYGLPTAAIGAAHDDLAVLAEQRLFYQPFQQEFTPYTALDTALKLECVRFNRLLHKVHQTLKALKLGIEGRVIMSEELEQTYVALLRNRVPKLWMAVCYESSRRLGSWVTDLIRRIDFIQYWLDLAMEASQVRKKNSLISATVSSVRSEISKADISSSHSRLPSRDSITSTKYTFDTSSNFKGYPDSFWLPAFFYPQGFLTSALQHCARILNLPVDTIQFQHNILGYEDTSTMYSDFNSQQFGSNQDILDGFIIYGLHLDGAHWDEDFLSLRDPKIEQKHSMMPSITCKAVEISRIKEEKSGRYFYECPVYITPSRAGSLSSTGLSNNFVTSINLPSDHPPEHWVLRGVALLCQPED